MLRQIVLKLKPFRIFSIVTNDHPLMIQNLANVAIFFIQVKKWFSRRRTKWRKVDFSNGFLMFHWKIKC